MEQAVLFLEQIPADGGTRHSPGGSSGRGLEPGRSVREPDIPVLERNIKTAESLPHRSVLRQFNQRPRNETGTGGIAAVNRDLAANHGQRPQASHRHVGPASFGSYSGNPIARCKNHHPTGDGSPQHAPDVRRDARTGGTMNRAGSEVLELNTVATTRDAGGENQLPVVWVAREDCGKACGTDGNGQRGNAAGMHLEDSRPLLPRIRGVSRMSSRSKGRGGEGGKGEWIKGPSSPEAADSEGSEMARMTRPRARPRRDNPRAVQPREQTSSFMDISRNGRLITELASNWALPCQPGLPGREDAATSVSRPIE